MVLMFLEPVLANTWLPRHCLYVPSMTRRYLLNQNMASEVEVQDFAGLVVRGAAHTQLFVIDDARSGCSKELLLRVADAQKREYVATRRAFAEAERGSADVATGRNLRFQRPAARQHRPLCSDETAPSNLTCRAPLENVEPQLVIQLQHVAELAALTTPYGNVLDWFLREASGSSVASSPSAEMNSRILVKLYAFKSDVLGPDTRLAIVDYTRERPGRLGRQAAARPVVLAALKVLDQQSMLPDDVSTLTIPQALDYFEERVLRPVVGNSIRAANLGLYRVALIDEAQNLARDSALLNVLETPNVSSLATLFNGQTEAVIRRSIGHGDRQRLIEFSTYLQTLSNWLVSAIYQSQSEPILRTLIPLYWTSRKLGLAYSTHSVGGRCQVEQPALFQLQYEMQACRSALVDRSIGYLNSATAHLSSEQVPVSTHSAFYKTFRLASRNERLRILLEWMVFLRGPSEGASSPVASNEALRELEHQRQLHVIDFQFLVRQLRLVVHEQEAQQVYTGYGPQRYSSVRDAALPNELLSNAYPVFTTYFQLLQRRSNRRSGYTDLLRVHEELVQFIASLTGRSMSAEERAAFQTLQTAVVGQGDVREVPAIAVSIDRLQQLLNTRESHNYGAWVEAIRSDLETWGGVASNDPQLPRLCRQWAGALTTFRQVFTEPAQHAVARNPLISPLLQRAGNCLKFFSLWTDWSSFQLNNFYLYIALPFLGSESDPALRMRIRELNRGRVEARFVRALGVVYELFSLGVVTDASPVALRRRKTELLNRLRAIRLPDNLSAEIARLLVE